MSTINSKDIVDQIIENNGYYADDPRVIKIVKYRNSWGGTAYGLIYEGQNPNNYDASNWIHDPETIFEIKKG